MKLVSTLTLALALVAVASNTLAAQHDQQRAHHPAGSASAPMSKSMPGKSTPEMARMANQMAAMHEMHDKMMAAKTPAERNALMAAHMKTMQEGMGMMKSMGGMTDAKGMPVDMPQRQTMMEQRMDMMQSMMEMMVDRLPQSPAKP